MIFLFRHQYERNPGTSKNVGIPLIFMNDINDEEMKQCTQRSWFHGKNIPYSMPFEVLESVFIPVCLAFYIQEMSTTYTCEIRPCCLQGADQPTLSALHRNTRLRVS